MYITQFIFLASEGGINRRQGCCKALVMTPLNIRVPQLIHLKVKGEAQERRAGVAGGRMKWEKGEEQ